MEITPEFAEVLAAEGIRDHASAMSFSGGHLVAAHRGRSVVRLGGSLYLKRFLGRPKEVHRERRALRRLAEGDGPDPVPVAAWGIGDGGAFLLTASPVGCRPFPDALRALDGADRRRMLRTVGERIRALHDRGLTCPDLVARHLLCGLPDRVHLLDAARLGPRSGRKARMRDLAALDQSLEYGVASASDRARILAAYLGGSPGDEPETLEALHAAAAKLARRRRHRRGRLVAGPADREFLAGLGIGGFEDLMAWDGPGAVSLRKLPDRENLRIETGGRTFFVKRHEPVRGRGPTPAAAEWDAVRRFRRAGIRAMRAVAFGEDVEKGSTIWVEASPGIPLDDLLKDRGDDPRLRRELILEAAGILRTMRNRELHHRDMYCCHLIADADAPAGERLTVIDLQRARGISGLRRRWYVKDVAQLHHSAPRPPVTRTDAIRFLRAYFGVGKLGPAEKRFARRVLRKAARI
jgi:heptose I phosphotransferase